MKLVNTLRLLGLLCLTGFFALYTHAYDGDVDFSAPYITVDPETGKLVTIDPKAQTKTPHVTPGSSNSAASINTENQPETRPQSTTALTQATSEMATATSSNTERSGNLLPILIGLLIAGFAAAFIYRNKTTGDASTDQNSSN